MEALVLFLVTLALSIVGSLQAGLVNTAVLTCTLRSGRKDGRLMALGGSLPELLYAAIAFRGSSLIERHLRSHGQWMEVLAGGFLVVLGLCFLFVFDATLRSAQQRESTKPFLKGLFLGLLNPQLVVFWCGVKITLSAAGWTLVGPAHLLSFSAGAFVGALLLLLLLVAVGAKLQERYTPHLLRRVFRAIGLVLLALGVRAFLA